MLTKIAGVVLAASVVALAVGGVTGATRRHPEFLDLKFNGGIYVFRDGDVKRELMHQRREQRERRHERRIIVYQHDAAVLGTYVFDANGNPLGKLPWSAHVELELRPEGRYELRVGGVIDGEPEEETSWGRYTVHGDRLTLFSAHDDDQFEFLITPNRLVFDGKWAAKLALKAVGVDEMYMTRR
ncbi:MAG: hypothetical protein ACRENP_25490 [Longimicrobiales bacterium]